MYLIVFDDGTIVEFDNYTIVDVPPDAESHDHADELYADPKTRVMLKVANGAVVWRAGDTMVTDISYNEKG